MKMFIRSIIFQKNWCLYGWEKSVRTDDYCHNILWALQANILNINFTEKIVIFKKCLAHCVISSPDDGKEKKGQLFVTTSTHFITAKENLNADLYASWTIPNNFHYLIWKHRCMCVYTLLHCWNQSSDTKWIH